MAEKEDITSVFQKIREWSEKSGATAFGGIETGLGAAKEGRAPGASSGLDPDMIKNASEYSNALLNNMTGINNIQEKYNVGMGRALKMQKSMLSQQNKSGAIGNAEFSRQSKMLELMGQQFKAEKKRSALTAVMGKKSMGMMAMAKGGAGGAAAKGLGGMAMKAAGPVGMAVGVANAAFEGILKAGTGFFKALNTIFDQGIEGILNVAVGAFAGLAGMLSSTLGGLVGTVGSLLVKIYMMHLQDWIAGQTMGVLALARTGRAGGEAFFGQMMGIVGGVRALAVEWGNAVIELGGKANAQFGEMFFRVGKTMQLTAAETRQYFHNALISAGEDVKKATSNVLDVFGAAKNMALQTNIPITYFSKSISDAAVHARMFNVDMKSVSNTMQMLVDKQATLRKHGVELRDQGADILKGLVNIPAQLSMAMHVFHGTEMFGKDYFDKKGKEMGVGYAWAASKWGEGTAKALEAGKGTTMPGTEDMLAKRIEMMRKGAEDAAADAGDGADKQMVKFAYLEQIHGQQSDAVKLAILSNRDAKDVAKDQKVQFALLPKSDIQSKLYTVADRAEQHQRQIAALVPIIVAILMALPEKLWSLIWGKKEELPFDRLWKAMTGKTEGVNKYIVGMMKPILQGITLYQKTVKDIEDEKYDQRIKSAGGPKAFLKKHQEEVAGRSTLDIVYEELEHAVRPVGKGIVKKRWEEQNKAAAYAREQLKTPIDVSKKGVENQYGGLFTGFSKIHPPEILAFSNKPVSVTSKEDTMGATSKNGMSAQFNIYIDRGSPQEILNALNAAVAEKFYQMG